MLYAGFMQLPLIKDAVFQESYSKKHVFMTQGSGNQKIVLALLTEIVAFHMQIAIGILGFKRPIQAIFSSFGIKSLVSDPFNISPYELLEKVFIWSKM